MTRTLNFSLHQCMADFRNSSRNVLNEIAAGFLQISHNGFAMLGLALVCAALSAQAHNLYFLLATGTHRSLVALLTMFTGDVLGTLLVFWMAHPWLKRLQPR